MGMCVRRLGNGIARALAGDAVRAERQIPVRARAAGTWKLRHGQRLGEPRRGDEREHERKGRFHRVLFSSGTLLGHCRRGALKSLDYFGRYIAASWDARRLASAW